MFFLQFLSTDFLEYIVFGILGIGFFATLISVFFINPLLRFLPGIAGTYRLIQLASICIFLLGIYLWGSFSTEKKWRDRVEKAEAVAKEAEILAKEANLELTKALAQRDHAIATRGKTIIERTREYIKGDTEVITKDLSEDERKKLKAEIEELRRAEKECPVPKLIIKGINEAASRPPENKDKK